MIIVVCKPSVIPFDFEKHHLRTTGSSHEVNV